MPKFEESKNLYPIRMQHHKEGEYIHLGDLINYLKAEGKELVGADREVVHEITKALVKVKNGRNFFKKLFR